MHLGSSHIYKFQSPTKAQDHLSGKMCALYYQCCSLTIPRCTVKSFLFLFSFFFFFRKSNMIYCWHSVILKLENQFFPSSCCLCGWLLAGRNVLETEMLKYQGYFSYLSLFPLLSSCHDECCCSFNLFSKIRGKLRPCTFSSACFSERWCRVSNIL